MRVRVRVRNRGRIEIAVTDPDASFEMASHGIMRMLRSLVEKGKLPLEGVSAIERGTAARVEEVREEQRQHVEA